MYGQDYMTIGSSPTDETCSQLGAEDYEMDAKNECRIFIQQLKRVFGDPPGNARLSTKGFPHDFGTYYEVVVWYSPNNEKETDYAFKLEANTPAGWDAQAKKDLVAANLRLPV